MHDGHPLEFGTFVTPRSDRPDETVELARRSEDLGFDLVTVQDHPYQPAFLDTWTVLSWIAGRTQRIRLAPNVVSLPMRDPAVLARSAASLDLLSGGRVELGLGAGASWDAIGAMGGHRREPGAAVQALREALEVIRMLWDGSSPEPASFAGEHYRLERAERGPTPAHDIPVIVGALKPRMLRLIGEKADGWLPSLGRLTRDELRAGTKLVDEAARGAGRDPREIRRLLNISGRFDATSQGFLHGPPGRWVDDLLPFVVEDGVSMLILAVDDVETMECFAREVAPALRDAVRDALPAETLVRSPVRRAAVRAKRHPGIAYDRVPRSLTDAVIEPGDVGYARVRSTYMRGGEPGLVLRPATTAQVVDALAFARTHPHLPLGIRSGGHGISGRSTNHGGLVVDLSRLDGIEVLDRSTRRVRIGPGARWMNVASALAPYGWALSSGDYGGVGVGGLATAGGIGWLARKHGLTIDHLRAVEMVLADGSVVRASDEENPDLFWAVRGAGAAFGVATSFEFEVDEVRNVGWAQLVFDASDPAFLQKWGDAVEAAPRDLTSFLLLGPPRRGQPMIAQTMTMVATEDTDTILRRLQPLADIAPLYDQSVVLVPYAGVMANASGEDHDGHGEPIGRSALIEHITPEVTSAVGDLLRSGATYFFQVRSVGGAVSDVDPDATAYAHRSANFSFVAFGARREPLNAAWSEVQRHATGLYVSFDTELRADRLGEAFPAHTLARLRELKQRYDPDNVFRDNLDITPATGTGGLR